MEMKQEEEERGNEMMKRELMEDTIIGKSSRSINYDYYYFCY